MRHVRFARQERLLPGGPAIAQYGREMLDVELSQEPTDRQITLSPRLGVSFPITDNSKLYFNYGHFREMPNPISLFNISEINTGAVRRIGNPNLDLPKTVERLETLGVPIVARLPF